MLRYFKSFDFLVKNYDVDNRELIVHRKDNLEILYILKLDSSGKKILSCSCSKLLFLGLPCSHTFVFLKWMGEVKIENILIYVHDSWRIDKFHLYLSNLSKRYINNQVMIIEEDDSNHTLITPLQLVHLSSGKTTSYPIEVIISEDIFKKENENLYFTGANPLNEELNQNLNLLKEININYDEIRIKNTAKKFKEKSENFNSKKKKVMLNAIKNYENSKYFYMFKGSNDTAKYDVIFALINFLHYSFMTLYSAFEQMNTLNSNIKKICEDFSNSNINREEIKLKFMLEIPDKLFEFMDEEENTKQIFNLIVENLESFKFQLNIKKRCDNKKCVFNTINTQVQFNSLNKVTISSITTDLDPLNIFLDKGNELKCRCSNIQKIIDYNFQCTPEFIALSLEILMTNRIRDPIAEFTLAKTGKNLI